MWHEPRLPRFSDRALARMPALLIIPSAVDPPVREQARPSRSDAAPRRTNDLDRLGLACWACPPVDGRRDDQAPSLSQLYAVGGALAIIPEPERPRRRLALDQRLRRPPLPSGESMRLTWRDRSKTGVRATIVPRMFRIMANKLSASGWLPCWLSVWRGCCHYCCRIGSVGLDSIQVIAPPSASHAAQMASSPQLTTAGLPIAGQLSAVAGQFAG
jgi:hypothetical protein